MKRFIIESDDDRLTGDLIVELLENEVDLSAKVKEVELIDEDKLDNIARTLYQEKTYLEFPTEDRVRYFKAGYRKYESEII